MVHATIARLSDIATSSGCSSFPASLSAHQSGAQPLSSAAAVHDRARGKDGSATLRPTSWH
jgi:hypothetical protein